MTWRSGVASTDAWTGVPLSVAAGKASTSITPVSVSKKMMAAGATLIVGISSGGEREAEGRAVHNEPR